MRCYICNKPAVGSRSLDPFVFYFCKKHLDRVGGLEDEDFEDEIDKLSDGRLI